VVIDALLKDVGWNLTDGRSVRYEAPLGDGSWADDVLCDRLRLLPGGHRGQEGVHRPVEAQGPALAYAEQLGAPFIFLSNGGQLSNKTMSAGKARWVTRRIGHDSAAGE